MREADSEQKAYEVIQSTHLYKSNRNELLSIIKKCNYEWFLVNQNLVPESKWFHIIWNEKKDVFLTMEDEGHYYAFNWELNSG